MRNDDIDRALRFLRQARPCRVCGTVFKPEKWHAILCSDTCRSRRKRGQDLQYIDWLATEAARHEARCFHKNVADLIIELQTHYRAIEAHRRERDTAEMIGRYMLSHHPEIMATIVLEFIEIMKRRMKVRPEMVTPDIVMRAINDTIPSCPTELAAQVQATVLDRLRSSTASASSTIMTVNTTMTLKDMMATPVAPGAARRRLGVGTPTGES
jgi:hypothetical protein